MIKSLCFCLFIFAVSGCASTPADVRIPKNHYSTKLDIPYQRVWKNIMTGINTCNDHRVAFVGSVIEQVNHYDDLKEVEIIQGINTTIFNVIDIKAIDEKSTQLDAYRTHAAQQYGKVVHYWALGEDVCETRYTELKNKPDPKTL